MRRWNLSLEKPFSLPLAADARCGQTDYSNDQIWELSAGSGEPPAITLHTTFGLRARSLRLFPRFMLDDFESSDPAEFARSPVLRSFYPNFARFECAPFANIDVTGEFWVPQSHAIMGRFWINNQTNAHCTLRLEWAAVLTPSEGQRMAADQIQGTPVLCGQTGNLFPVVFLAGGAQPGKSPYPSLSLELDLPPGEGQPATWCHVALGSHEESFELIRQLAALPWEAHIARLDMLNAGQLEVYTGDPEWDLALALSQNIGFGLIVGPTSHLPEKSFVSTRLPDQGYSLRGDGSDYSHLWSGQTPLDAYYLSGFVLPGSADFLRGILRNFLASQGEDGFIDWKPGLGGQRSRLLATPLLAALVWRLYQATGELDSQAEEFMVEAFPHLLSFFNAWFSREHDADQDGMPELDHSLQTGFEDHPAFSYWLAWSQGVDVSTAESPALGAMLYNECRALARIARLLGHQDEQHQLEQMADSLRTQVESMWDAESGSYQYRDRDSHLTPSGEALGTLVGAGKILVQRKFPNPVRPMLRIQSRGETRPLPTVFIHGESASGQHRIERIEGNEIRWALEQGVLTGQRGYTSIEMVDIQGLLPQDEVTFYTADYCGQDLTLLLPLWAGIPTKEQGAELVERTLINPQGYWREFGLPACLHYPAEAESICSSVLLPLNCLVGEGLVAYGFRAQAAELVSRLMAGIIQIMKREGGLRRSFNAEGGEAVGDRNALGGLAPLDLFMNVIGMRLVSPYCVHLEGFNPYPWPVTVKYRGMTVMRQKEKSVVIFPDGQTVEVTDPEPQRICLESSPRKPLKSRKKRR